MDIYGTVRQMLDLKGTAVWHVQPEDTVYQALELMDEKNVGAVVVIEADRLVGIVSERDYARKGILHGRTSRETRVREIMSANVVSVLPEQTVQECMQLMTDNRIRHLPVVVDERVVGIVSIGDVVKATIAAQAVLIEQLQDYIVGKAGC
jgi:CBS domain-containing protein